MQRYRPTILSLAPTRLCLLKCACCYLHNEPFGPSMERDIGFFCELLIYAAASGLEEVAASVNSFISRRDKNFLALDALSRQAVELNMRFSVTTNYENIERWGAGIYQRCSLVSLSYDEFKLTQSSSLVGLARAAKALKSKITTVNLNVLLTRRIMQDFKAGLLSDLLGVADSVYLLLPKHYPTDFSRQEFMDFLEWLSPLFEDFSTFNRVILDNCVKPFIFPFSEVYPNCGRGYDIVAVGPEGTMSYTVYDPPYAVLHDPAEFPVVFQQMYGEAAPGISGDFCRNETTCPWIQFC